jgi:hypothetical protein
MKSLVFLFLLLTPAFAFQPIAGSLAPKLDIKDVKDRPLTVPRAGRVMLLSFASQSTGVKAGEITRAIRVQHPDVEILSFINLSSYPRFLRGMIRGQVRSRQEGAVKEAQEAFKRAGKNAPEDLDAHIHIIPDFDASSCKTYGAMETSDQAQIVLIGADGKVKAFFAKTPSIDDIKAALKKELDGTNQ